MVTALFRRIALLPIDERRPSLFDLWSKYKFQSGVLAIKAKVPPGTVQAMLGNQAISRDHAQKILTALSSLLHKEYKLESVCVALIAEEEEIHENTEKAPTDERFTACPRSESRRTYPHATKKD